MNKTALFLLCMAVFLISIALTNAKAFNSYFIGDDLDEIEAVHDKGAASLIKLFYSDWLSFHTRWVKQLSEAFSHTGKTGMIRPFLSMSHKIEFMLFGTNPIGYRLVNFSLHFFNTVLVFLLVNFLSGRMSFGFMAAMLFAITPVRFQIIGWIGCRAELMMGFFFLLSFYLFILFRAKKNKAYYIVSILAFFLALFTKENAVMLPIALIGYDVTDGFNLNFSKLKLNAEWLKRIKDRLPAWAPYLLILVSYLLIRKVNLGSFMAGYGVSHFNLSLKTRLRILISYFDYNLLAAPYDFWTALSFYDQSTYRVILASLGVLLPLFVIGRNRLNWRLFKFGIFFFTVSYAPVFFYPSTAPWIFYLPTLSTSALLVALIFSLPWKQVSVIATSLLILFFGYYQFKYSSDFSQAGDISRCIRESAESFAKNLSEGDTIILVDIPHTYHTAYIFPQISSVEAALSKPFTPTDIARKIHIKWAYVTQRLRRGDQTLDEVLQELDERSNGSIHILKWNAEKQALEEMSSP